MRTTAWLILCLLLSCDGDAPAVRASPDISASVPMECLADAAALDAFVATDAFWPSDEGIPCFQSLCQPRTVCLDGHFNELFDDVEYLLCCYTDGLHCRIW